MQKHISERTMGWTLVQMSCSCTTRCQYSQAHSQQIWDYNLNISWCVLGITNTNVHISPVLDQQLSFLRFHILNEHICLIILPLLGAEESDTLLVRPGAGDLRWPRLLGDMLLPVRWSEKTLGDWGMCCVPVLPSHVLQYAFRVDSGDRCWVTFSAESGVAGPEAVERSRLRDLH